MKALITSVVAVSLLAGPVSVASDVTEIALKPSVKALLVKVRWSTQEPRPKLAPRDFVVKYDSEANEFTLRASPVEPAVGEPREPGASIPGTAVILIHPNGVPTRRLKLGPGLKLQSLEQLAVAK